MSHDLLVLFHGYYWCWCYYSVIVIAIVVVSVTGTAIVVVVSVILWGESRCPGVTVIIGDGITIMTLIGTVVLSVILGRSQD